jgi:polysaccharide chain length determinant protein (PEP-CTERM system associated)
MLGHQELTIDDILTILRRRMRVIIIPLLAGPLIAYAISLKLPARYTSKTLILVEGQKVPDSFVKPVVTGDLTSRLGNIEERILSRTRLESIIERLHPFPDVSGQASMEDLVVRLRKAIELAPTTPIVGSKEADLPGFYVSVTLSTPQLAQQVCTEIASMLIGENLRQREQSAQGTTSFLQTQLDDAKRRLDEQDAKLASFKSRYMGELPDEAQTNLNILGSLNTQLDAVTQALDRAQADKAYTEALLRQQVAAWEAAEAGNNPHPETLEQQIAGMESVLVSLKARYTEDYPEVVKLQSQIESLRKKVADAAANKNKLAPKPRDASDIEPIQIQQLRSQVHMYEQAIQERTRQQQKLEERIRLYQSRVQLSPAVEQQYRQVTRDYQTAREFYDDLLRKKDQSVMGTDLELRQQGEQFRVMDPADLPKEPSFPDLKKFVGGGFGGGLVLGLGLALLLEMRDKAVRTEQDVQFFLHQPTLALVPTITRIKTAKKRWRPPAKKIKSEMAVVCGAEEFRKLRSHLELLREQQQLRTVLISSPLPQEGKTFACANLAQVMARQREHRVLVVDADLRLPRLHLSLGANLTPGLSEYLSGASDEFSIIQRGPFANLSFISGGELASNPNELIGNGRLKLLLQALAPAFDWIILDSPPAAPVSDARLLAELCDGVLLVIEAGETPFDIAQKACQEFRDKSLLGVILNRVDPTYAYSSYYGSYYKPRLEGETLITKTRKT